MAYPGAGEMPYTAREIEDDWLGQASGLALGIREVERLFNLVAARFGREWVEEARRTSNGAVIRGVSPTLYIAMIGQWLEATASAVNLDGLLEKVKQDDVSAQAELLAVYLSCSGRTDVAVEIEPQIIVEGARDRNRVPDFRVRQSDDNDWVYVEVAQPGESQAHAEVNRRLERLSNLVNHCQGSFKVEVFLLREPDDVELDEVATLIIREHADLTQRRYELPGSLGALYWNFGPPRSLVLEDHGEPYAPRLSVAGFVDGGGDFRLICVRWPFTDLRAQDFLRREARQLPKDCAGIVMMEVSRAPGAMRVWRELIKRRFQSRMHTRVSGVCLFSSGQTHVNGESLWRPEVKMVVNPYAQIGLPEWIVRQFEGFPSELSDL